ncbi:MAG TPA: SRPBCC family protein [Myxococcota bacterium]|jgi:uncharacterized protein YndB with AHSA1/START domain|nr:SRPBCC family protein [Myxococcota bacterium]
MQEIEVERRIGASPARVWSILSDHEGMRSWMPVREVVRRRPGAPDPNGVGAVRTIRGMGLVIEERITEFEPPARLVYELTEGAPIRDHRGEVTLAPEDGGTRVRWRVRFRPAVPGTGGLLAFVLRRGLAGGLERLARLVEGA